MRNLLPPDQVTQRLSKTVPTLETLTAGLSPGEWLFRPSKGDWSITETICHLRDVDREIHLPRLRSLIAEKEPFMPGVVSDKWVIERNYQAQDGRAALAALTASREELLGLLPAADSPIWARRGRHTFFGPTLFLELACLALEHDILHIGQIEEILAATAQSN